MRQSLARYSATVSFVHAPSLADFITTIVGFEVSGIHNDEKRGAASLKPPPDTYRLAKARMKSVGDACFGLLFAGSMSPFRAGPESP
jgi:hypothetical protein